MDIIKEKIAENLCKSGFEQFRNGTNYLSICEQLELNEEIHDDAGIFICKEDKKSWEDDVEQFLNFEIEPGVTLKDVIEFYFKCNKLQKTEEELLEILKNHESNYIPISDKQSHCHCEWCNQFIRESSPRIYTSVDGKDCNFCNETHFGEWLSKRAREEDTRTPDEIENALKRARLGLI